MLDGHGEEVRGGAQSSPPSVAALLIWRWDGFGRELRPAWAALPHELAHSHEPHKKTFNESRRR